mmetsp:Transcript_26931/g.78120  ORF Transcript_26931/g.78120 Transcript_26931/m.78120 type:complete len:214 (-) Transcript_26931:495-1136(-)
MNQATVVPGHVRTHGYHAALVHGLDHRICQDLVAAAVRMPPVQRLEHIYTHGEDHIDEMSVRLLFHMLPNSCIDGVYLLEVTVIDENDLLRIRIARQDKHDDLGVFSMDRADRVLQSLGRYLGRVDQVGHHSAAKASAGAVHGRLPIIHEICEHDNVGATDALRDCGWRQVRHIAPVFLGACPPVRATHIPAGDRAETLRVAIVLRLIGEAPR